MNLHVQYINNKTICFFFSRYVLELSDGIDSPGIVKWELFVCLLIAWIGIYFCMWKGVKSSGKV